MSRDTTHDTAAPAPTRAAQPHARPTCPAMLRGELLATNPTSARSDSHARAEPRPGLARSYPLARARRAHRAAPRARLAPSQPPAPTLLMLPPLLLLLSLLLPPCCCRLLRRSSSLRCRGERCGCAAAAAPPPPPALAQTRSALCGHDSRDDGDDSDDNVVVPTPRPLHADDAGPAPFLHDVGSHAAPRTSATAAPRRARTSTSATAAPRRAKASATSGAPHQTIVT